MNKSHSPLGQMPLSRCALWCFLSLTATTSLANPDEGSTDTNSAPGLQVQATGQEVSSATQAFSEVGTPLEVTAPPAQTVAESDELLASGTSNEGDSADVIALIDSTELPVISFMQDDAPVLAGPLTGPNGLLGLGSVYGANIQEIMGIDGARNSLIPDATLIDLLTSGMPPTMPFTTSRVDSITSVLQPVQTPAAGQPGMVALTTAPVPVSTLPAPLPTPDTTVPVVPATPAAPSPVDTPPDTMVSP